MPHFYDIISLMTGEFIEGGFESYGAAVRFFESEGYDYDNYAIVEAEDELQEEDPDDGYSFPGWGPSED
jgi:hypothetical protein